MSLSHDSRSSEVLVVDGDPRVIAGLTQLLAEQHVIVTAAETHAEAIAHCGRKFFGVILIDLDCPGPNQGIDLLLELKPVAPASTFIMLTRHKSFDGAAAAFRAGAADVVVKAPEQVEYLRRCVLSAASEVTRDRGMRGLLQQVAAIHDEFLKRLMDTDRRLVDLRDQVAGRDISRADFEAEFFVLVVDDDATLFQQLGQLTDRHHGFSFKHATTGGEAMDRVGRGRLHVALVKEHLPDLPVSMVVRAMKDASPDMIVIEFAPPPGGHAVVVEGTHKIPLIERLDAAQQIVDHFAELREAFIAKGRERRYLQAFRDQHYEFLRKYADLKKRLQKQLSEEE